MGGLGQLALYGMALVGLSFYVRERMGRRLWRLVHMLSFAIFILALAHGVMSGSDSGTAYMRVFYWASGGSVLFLSVYRVLIASHSRSVSSGRSSAGRNGHRSIPPRSPPTTLELGDARRAARHRWPDAAILAQMAPEGFWVTLGPGYNPKYRSTVWSVILLAELGASI